MSDYNFKEIPDKENKTGSFYDYGQNDSYSYQPQGIHINTGSGNNNSNNENDNKQTIKTLASVFGVLLVVVLVLYFAMTTLFAPKPFDKEKAIEAVYDTMLTLVTNDPIQGDVNFDVETTKVLDKNAGNATEGEKEEVMTEARKKLGIANLNDFFTVKAIGIINDEFEHSDVDELKARKILKDADFSDDVAYSAIKRYKQALEDERLQASAIKDNDSFTKEIGFSLKDLGFDNSFDLDLSFNAKDVVDTGFDLIKSAHDFITPFVSFN